ncbi:hypothetical protein HMF8227_00090 [Saliniradius amylolyticus]|uniref:Catalase n=1 Tax=Saliniradius amylolyticus TaxID=2183582 RepID=A0A2S2DYX1_9ALTE|nr:putative metalloprotease CJM1_0395 family protein [Saliniradius amylolyticus]AWL10598.1 hypothetical protein HMF8227_00090 [Saliniradius amylolyticus]
MSIVTPAPLGVPFTTANHNTESARRDNLAREVIPQPSQADESGAEKGLGADSERARQNQQAQNSPTYDKPQNAQSSESEQQANNSGKDNGKDESAGKQDAERRQQEANEKEVKELQERDREVRQHEQAHANRGGQYAGAPSYEYQRGPDGQQYAVGGEVSIDISEEPTPEQTIRKMEQVKAAALAPAEPSPQDYRVANEAQQTAVEARGEVAKESMAQAQKAVSQAGEGAEEDGSYQPPSPDETADGGITVGRRTLSESDPVAEAAGLASDSREFKQMLARRDNEINQRSLRIANFYAQVTQPVERGLVQQSI